MPVKYLRDHEVEQRFDALGRTTFDAQGAANALSYKRYPYRYEREVRWVHITEEACTVEGRTSVMLDVNQLIDQIMIDPRLNAAQAAVVEAEAREAGFKNEVRHSRLFELPVRLRPFANRGRVG